MSTSKPNHQILREFEKANADSNCSAYEFIRSSQDEIGVSLQLGIIAVAVELQLCAGIPPSLDELTQNFPYLDPELKATVADTIDEFVREHCPITSAVGELPREVDGYLVEREIGRGGMGVVYQATQLSLDRSVALKVLFFSREDILSEARSLASLVHPNICGAYDIGLIAGLPFMAMQYLEGLRLTDYIKQNTPLPLESCVEIICQLAQAMQEAHDIGITHLDIKPSNVIIVNQTPILTDFGLARRDNESVLSFFGSPSFLAPEQLSGEPIANRRLCDVYSLGTVLYEMLTGRRAFHGTVKNIMSQVLNDPPRRPSDYRHDINDALESVCLRAMHKNPANRFLSMTEFRDELLTSLR